MRGLQGFQIQLENSNRSFFPGETINGKVFVSLDKPKDLKYISITFEGRASVHWTESHKHSTGSGSNRRTENRTVHYIAEENYFTCKIMLLGHEGNAGMTLPVGTSFYPFRFTLPLNLPSSYVSKTGKVLYFMTACMKRSLHKSDLTSIVPFTINGVLDLNTEFGVSDPVELIKNKSICCGCCKSGPVGFILKFPRKGFVPGEYLPFNAELTNMSSRRVKRCTLKLMQYVSYQARGKTKSESTTICQVVGPGVPQGESESWSGGNSFRIPPIPPTRLAGCHIIDVQYRVKFEMELSGAALNLKIELPIIIGTIPLRTTFVDLMPSSRPGVPIANASQWELPNYNALLPGYLDSTNASQPQFQPGVPYNNDLRPGTSSSNPNSGYPAPSAPIFSAYPDLPPPTYAEAVGMDWQTNVGPIEHQNKAYSPDHDDSINKGGTNVNQVQNGGSNEGTAPPPDYEFMNNSDFVPNYITYGFLSPTNPQ